ncbi:TPA: hypothetical protein PXM26_003993 [Yersinia enterocolitica]|nr:hypothetical protein [Yersinia enterocolitica]
MYMLQQKTRIPYVFLVDSPSPDNIFLGYSIGMALRDSLRAICIPCFYYMATNRQIFDNALNIQLQSSVSQMEQQPNINAVPFIHLCMHGAHDGIALTDKSFVSWNDLRIILKSHNYIKGTDPFICMASCNGINATQMASAFDSAFDIVICNQGALLQSDVTVAYLAFYNQLYHKNASIEQAVHAMKISSGDVNFYYALGTKIKNQKFFELNNQLDINPWGAKF